MTEAMYGVFPASEDLSGVRRVLDIACGPGGWALDLAFHYPDIEVIGIDINPQMIEYAQAQAQIQHLSNATFLTMDARSLHFPEEHFDLVNGRLLFGLMKANDWPDLWTTVKRMLRPGGRVRWTELDGSATTSLACNTMNRLLSEALYRAGQSISPGGNSLGIAPIMAKLLRSLGYDSVRCEAYVIEAAYEESYYEVGKENMEMAFKLFQPFLVEQKVASQQELDTLYDQVILEAEDPSFCSVIFLLSVWGTR